MIERVRDIDFGALREGRSFFPSPQAWEDQALYFLLVDRFSDGKERGYKGNDGRIVPGGETPPYDPARDAGNAVADPAGAAAWREAGGRRCGGGLRGLGSKIGYLRRLGITAVWLSPVFKQVAFADSYHGYGIQDFLSVDPRLGDLADLRAVVEAAHEAGIYVILDIILNHSGDVFAYSEPGGAPPWRGWTYPVAGFKDSEGRATIPFLDYSRPGSPSPAGPDDAIWPREFQDPSRFSRKGRINNWDDEAEFREGDFFDLKDLDHGSGPPDSYRPSPALLDLCLVYKYWIAAADIDGYRIDTVKHMDVGATRFFVAAIKEFAQTLGKEKFFLIGEITGGRERAVDTMEETGLDAALGIDDVQLKLEGLMKGESDPEGYFGLFRNSALVRKNSHVWFKDRIVTMINDHDQVCKGEAKARFCAGGEGDKLVLGALALNATTLGIPCIYYGTEQGFDGRGEGGGADRYIREAMFGGPFGAFRSRGRHFFDEEGGVYRELSAILRVRAGRMALRRGRQYLREISGDGIGFGLPRSMGGRMLSVVPWSRILDSEEILLAVNTDPDNPRSAWAVVDSGLHPPGSSMTCAYSTRHSDEGAALRVERRGASMEYSAVFLEMPAAGFAILV
jgi:glycosidase